MDDPVRVVFHDECQLLDFGESRTSGPWIKLRLRDHTCLDAFRAITGVEKTTPNLHVTIAQGDIATLAQGETENHRPPYADAAALLWKSSFLRTPAVWSALGISALCETDRMTTIRLAQERAWNALKAHLSEINGLPGSPSMAEIPPAMVWSWAQEKQVARYLPNGYWRE